jgi:hypothetical protein
VPSATLKLTTDPATGKRTITISYTSDLDALPHEHEDAHRAIVEKLFEGGIAKPGDTIVVEREGIRAPEGVSSSGEEQREKERTHSFAPAGSSSSFGSALIEPAGPSSSFGSALFEPAGPSSSFGSALFEPAGPSRGRMT